jgi:glycerol uptake facilitator-like aquaporin
MLLGEALGTALLLVVVVGSGRMGEMLAQGNSALALLANSTATGLGLWWLIVLFAPICGAHFNPLVSGTLAARGELPWRDALARTLAQVVGALAGVALAHAMFELPLFAMGSHARTSPGLWLSEAVATCGLLLTILLGRRAAPGVLPALIGAYVAAAYWFTASTSFANPAVTLARAFTTTFAGTRLVDVPAFVAAQGAGAVLALMLERLLIAPAPGDAA